MVCIKIPRRDTNEVGEYEVTVTSELHAQAERTKKQKREDKAASSGGSDKDPEPGHRMMVLEQGGAPLVAVRFLGTVPETDLLVLPTSAMFAGATSATFAGLRRDFGH